jgi:predicted AlkP superfamily pyrophosphatase or phosphodiesterase
MKKSLMLALSGLFVLFLHAQKNNNPAPAASNGVPRPKLVIGLMVDQMRWDYLYRYQNRYGKDGFNRLLNQGFSCENTFIPYTPTATACGHACVYTGSVPSINGITGNNWWDSKLNRSMYCVEDKTVKTVGSDSRDGEMSPRNLVSNTITDELRLATNFRSKVIGISIKDRGSILPAGHSANAAYWYDENKGMFISSTYYMNDLPQWVKDFNARKLPDTYYAQGWNTLYPIETYTQSTADAKEYERTEIGPKNSFPYDMKGYIGKDYWKLPFMPQAATYTFEMAKAAAINEQMGKGAETDFLAVSVSSTDYSGHSFGPNAVELEDTYLRLDRDIADFLNFLDKQVGKGNYLLFLTADHGAAHVPGFLKEHNLPGGSVTLSSLVKKVNQEMFEQYQIKDLILNSSYYNLALNHKQIDSLKLDINQVKKTLIKRFEKEEGIYRIVDKAALDQSNLPNPIRERLLNGNFPYRSGDLQVLTLPAWFKDNPKGTDHSVWNPYDAHIPLVWYGWNVPQGKTNHEYYMTDIAVTLAAMLRVQMPNGAVGKAIEEITGKK